MSRQTLHRSGSRSASRGASSAPAPAGNRLRTREGEWTALIWLAVFAGVIALLGGSSRFDAVQIIALRPLAALFVIPALYFLTRDAIQPARTLVALLGLAAAWMAIQIVPLPPFIWQSLPGREAIVELDALHGLEGAWRPIHWAPMRGWNALLALVVPVSALLLALAMRPNVRTILAIIVGLGVVDAALGLLQIVGGNSGALYFYAKTNEGAPVGLFANENHSAVFSAIVLLVIARLGFSPRKEAREGARPLVLASAFLIVTLAVLASGSRAGLGVAVVAFLVIGVMAWLWFTRPKLQGEDAGRFAALAARPRLTLALGAALVAVIMLGLIQFGRLPAVVDAFSQSAFDDLRWRLGPILQEMMLRFWLLGTGFGSFDTVYQVYEPTEFMLTAYLNQAHNDWAQLVIEGGLPAIALLAALIGWMFMSVRSLYARAPEPVALCLFWITVLAIIAVASLFDYPLRTPIFQMVGVWLLLALAFDRHERKRARSSQGDSTRLD